MHLFEPEGPLLNNPCVWEWGSLIGWAHVLCLSLQLGDHLSEPSELQGLGEFWSRGPERKEIMLTEGTLDRQKLRAVITFSSIWIFKLLPIFPCYKNSFSFFFFFWATPAAYGRSQARGQIRAAAAGLCYSLSHSSTRSEPHLQPMLQLIAIPGLLTHWVGPRIEPASSWTLVGFLTHWTTVGTPRENSLCMKCFLHLCLFP